MSKNDTNWSLLVNIGSQMVAGVVLGLLIGYWLDKKFGWSPWGTIVCTLLGVAAGMYAIIKEGLKANQDPPKRPGK